MQLLGYAGSPFGYQSYSEGVSADGNTVVGYSYEGGNDGNRGGYQAWVWTASGGTRALLDYPGQTVVSSQAFAVSSSGSVIVGASGRHAVMWQNGSIFDLGTIDRSTVAEARSVSDDGSIVAGWSDFGDWVWTAPTGLITLRSYLESHGVFLPQVENFNQWHMTPNGRTFYGAYYNDSIVVTIPAPMSALLMALGVLSSRRHRRRTAMIDRPSR